MPLAEEATTAPAQASTAPASAGAVLFSPDLPGGRGALARTVPGQLGWRACHQALGWLAQIRGRPLAVKNQPSDPIADDEDDHAEQLAKTAGRGSWRGSDVVNRCVHEMPPVTWCASRHAAPLG